MVSKTFLIIALFAFFSVQVECFSSRAFAFRQARGLEDDIRVLLDQITTIKDQSYRAAIDEVNNRNNQLRTDAAAEVSQSLSRINSRINEFVNKINELVNIGVPNTCTDGRVEQIRATGTTPRQEMEQCSKDRQNEIWLDVSNGIRDIVDEVRIVDQLYENLNVCGQDISCLTDLLLRAYNVQVSLPRNIQQKTADIVSIINGALNQIKLCGVKAQSDVARFCVEIYTGAINCANN